MQRIGQHPVVYNARGTHGTFFEAGLQTTFDWTYPTEPWDFWKDLDVIFPWDYLKEDRTIKTDSNIDGINYLTQVNYWGNAGRGVHAAGERQMVDGPNGFLNKFEDRQAELEHLDYVCEGQDTTRCPWPFGLFSTNKPLCELGYFYSYKADKCY